MVRFQILGPTTVVGADGGRLRLSGERQRALLADLIIHANHVVSIDRLVDDLWGERPPPTVRASLLNLLSQLRRALGPGLLETRPPGYLLHLEEEQLDSARFEQLLARARTKDPRARIRTLEEALALWHGDPLADVFYETFAQPTVMRLDELRAKAFEDLFDAKLEAGSSEVARDLVPDLLAMVETYPYRERLRSQLMVALYRSGRQADALRVYDEWRTKLAQEWGVEPSPGLPELERIALALIGPPELGPELQDEQILGGTEGEAFPIEELKLGVPAYNYLRRAGFKTIGELAMKNEDELGAIPHFSEKSIEAVKETLAAYGLSLRPVPARLDLPRRHLLLLSALAQAGIDFVVAAPSRRRPRLICNPAPHELERLRHALLRLMARTYSAGRTLLLTDLSAERQTRAIRTGKLRVGDTSLQLEIGDPRSYNQILESSTEAEADGSIVHVLTPRQTYVGKAPDSRGAFAATGSLPDYMRVTITVARPFTLRMIDPGTARGRFVNARTWVSSAPHVGSFHGDAWTALVGCRSRRPAAQYR